MTTERGTEATPEVPEELELRAEKLAQGTYQPHRFGDTPAWFRACVTLATRLLQAEAALRACEEERDEAKNTIDSMLRCVGKNAANVDNPVEAIRLTYLNLVGEREENRALREQVERLSAPVSDEEWADDCNVYRTVGRGGAMDRPDIDALIQARAEQRGEPE